jgi:hypothetical protein
MDQLKFVNDVLNQNIALFAFFVIFYISTWIKHFETNTKYINF